MAIIMKNVMKIAKSRVEDLLKVFFLFVKRLVARYVTQNFLGLSSSLL